MKNAILFDKFKNRKEAELDKLDDEITMTEKEEEIKYKLQFFDNKRRAIYIEMSRTKLEN